MKKIFAFMLFSFVLIMVTYAQPKRFNINDTVSFSSLKSAAVADQFDIAIKNARPFALNPMVWNYSNVAIGDTLQLSLFPGKDYLSVIQSKTTDVNGTTVLGSKLVGFQFAWCFISIADQNVLFTIDIPERREKYSTRLLPQNHSQYLVQLDENKLDVLVDGQMPTESIDSLHLRFLSKNSVKSTQIETGKINLQNTNGIKSAQLAQGVGDTAQIDVLVVYTPAAKEWADTNEGGINNTISLAITNCNLVSENSKLGIKFNLVHSTEVDYIETGNSSLDLENLIFGQIYNVHILRDIVAADLVVLIENIWDFGGITYQLDNKFGNESMGFSISRVQEASGFATTIHEIGHNLGANHHKEQNYYPGPTIWSNWPENTWSAGWRWKDDDNNYYCDLMTYPTGAYFSDGITHIQVPYISDPEINVQGQPTGHPTQGNNARTIREMKHVVADYREGQHGSTPTVYTVKVSYITNDGAISGGYVVNEGESPVKARGIVWSSNRMPTLNDNYTVDGSGTGPFTSQLTGLVNNTTYYVRVYATNSGGTTYGNQVSLNFTGGVQRDFITRWVLPAGQEKLELLLDCRGMVEYTWETLPNGQSGSGTFQPGSGLVKIPNLPTGATIRLRIAPDNLKRFYSSRDGCLWLFGPDRENLVDVEQWGTVQWRGMKNAFDGCEKLNITATDLPDLGEVADMSKMFSCCEILNGPNNIYNWDVSFVRNMNRMFDRAFVFNQDIGGWDVSSVKDMVMMFNEAKTFNKDIGGWDVSSVTDFAIMFLKASAFNQDIGKWDVSHVTHMNGMFSEALAFNQDIGKWNVSHVIDMHYMFSVASAFNQDIGQWNVSSVTDMCGMFEYARTFNQGIGEWNVASVTTMKDMFLVAENFNQNIGRWNVSAVTDMSQMLKYAGGFNQDIVRWDVSAVTDMRQMFNYTSAFNQDIGHWNLTRVTNLENMLDNSGMDCSNYSATLSGWNANINTPENLVIGAQGLGFGNNAKDARANLTTTKKWTITGDAPTGAVCDLKTNLIGNKLLNSNLRLYPNPVANELTIEIEDNNEKFNFQIVNEMGQTVYNGSVIDRMVVQTRSFAPGLYLLRLENNNSFEFKKIIKE